MEDDLKILKMEYLSNHIVHLSQILNLNSGDQPEVEDNLQCKTTTKLKVEYLSKY